MGGRRDHNLREFLNGFQMLWLDQCRDISQDDQPAGLLIEDNFFLVHFKGTKKRSIQAIMLPADLVEATLTAGIWVVQGDTVLFVLLAGPRKGHGILRVSLLFAKNLDSFNLPFWFLDVRPQSFTIIFNRLKFILIDLSFPTSGKIFLWRWAY